MKKFIYLILFLFFSCDDFKNDCCDNGNDFEGGLNIINTNFDELNREYLIYIPESSNDSEKLPVVINLHGGSQYAQSYMDYTSDMRPIADTAKFILIYPQATLDDYGNPTWHLGAENSKSTSVDDVGYIEHIIEEVSISQNIDLERVYVCGFSNGAYLTYELACLLNDKIAGIGVVGGHMFIDTYNYCSPVHPTPIINIHGTDDFYDGISTYYLSQENSNNYWANYNNTNEIPIISQIENINVDDGSTVELYSWKDGDKGTTVEHYKIIGGGHDWPKINEISSGKEGYSNGDIDANILIWNYLSNYDINGIR